MTSFFGRLTWGEGIRNKNMRGLPNKATFFQHRDQLQNALVILMFQILCLSILLSPYNWGLSFHQLFHLYALPFSLTVILILDISLEIQLYISIVIWLGSSENLSYNIKRFSDSFASHQLELQLTTACYQSNIEIIFV